MKTTRLSSKGQVILPKALRDAHHWQAGQEFVVIDTEEGVWLKPRKPFSESRLEDVAGCLHYEGKAKTLDELDDAVRQGVLEQWQ